MSFTALVTSLPTDDLSKYPILKSIMCLNNLVLKSKTTFCPKRFAKYPKKNINKTYIIKLAIINTIMTIKSSYLSLARYSSTAILIK